MTLNKIKLPDSGHKVSGNCVAPSPTKPSRRAGTLGHLALQLSRSTVDRVQPHHYKWFLKHWQQLAEFAKHSGVP
jgi:hypothetical protein